MALIKTALTDSHLILSASGMENLSLPLTPTDGDIINSTIWQDQCDARTVSREADQWLSHFLNQDCRLVYQPDEMIRHVDPDYGRHTDNVAFSDGFPFLIISENSLASLNSEMQLNIPMTRFRPNLVISGCPSYAKIAGEKSASESLIQATQALLPLRHSNHRPGYCANRQRTTQNAKPYQKMAK